MSYHSGLWNQSENGGKRGRSYGPPCHSFLSFLYRIQPTDARPPYFFTPILACTVNGLAKPRVKSIHLRLNFWTFSQKLGSQNYRTASLFKLGLYTYRDRLGACLITFSRLWAVYLKTKVNVTAWKKESRNAPPIGFCSSTLFYPVIYPYR